MKNTNYTFKHDKDCFEWSNDTIKLIFREPVITAINEGLPVESINDIMYFYYDIEIHILNCGNWDIKTMQSFDFPGIFQLQDILSNLDPESQRCNFECQENIISDDESIFVRTERTDSLRDDMYEIVISLNSKTDYETCNLFVGFHHQNKSVCDGFYFHDLTIDDFISLKETVDSFIKYAISMKNIVTAKSNYIMRSSLVKIGDNLYQYMQNYSTVNPELDPKKIEAIYAVGDVVNVDYINSECSKCENVEGVLNKIENDSICVDGIEYKFDDIVALNNSVPDEILKYNISQAKKDFMDIMGNYEKIMFMSMPKEILFNLYSEAIVNRTWMCREEHNFPLIINLPNSEEYVKMLDNCDDVDFNVKNALAIACQIIREIRCELLEHVKLNEISLNG